MYMFYVNLIETFLTAFIKLLLFIRITPARRRFSDVIKKFLQCFQVTHLLSYRFNIYFSVFLLFISENF